jgi:predicted nucleic acid-binding protein
VSAPSVVVDTNIIFAALVSRRSQLRERIFTEPGMVLHCPRFLFVELFKHKERIRAATQLPEEELLDFLHILLERVRFVDEAAIPIGTWLEARRLCRGTDEKDTPFVAVALHLNAPLWTEDDLLKQGLRAKGFVQFYEP